MKITFDFFTKEQANEFFSKNYPVVIATAEYKDGKTLCEVHSDEKKTKELALKNLKQTLKSEGIAMMHKLLKGK